jgi:Na+/H+-dicarboxylate symporter/ABC-type amino acid transport substrate-binding protein
MSFSRKVLAGLVSGLALGLFLGEYVAPLKVAADGFVKLLQMTVLPYVVLSIVSSLGALDAEQARRLGKKAGAVLLLLWLVAVGFAFLFPLAFPDVENANFFSTTLVERRPPFDFVGLYIPSNPFHSLANNVVPAVVLFSIVIGIALIGVERKQVLLDVLAVAGTVVSRATRFVVGLTPYGIFAISATAAGTLDLQQLGRIQVFLLTYVVMATVLALWVLPGLVSALTPIRYREVLSSTRDALITAFMAGDLFIVLPSLIEASKVLLARHGLTGSHAVDLPDVIVPASFNFPHTGKLLSLSFVLFAGWFADAAVPLSDYPRLAITGFLTFFGSLNAAVPFLLDIFRIPADTFQLFLATSVVNARFGSLIAALHTVAVALLGSAAIVGALRMDAARLVRFLVVTAVLTAACLAGLRITFTTVLAQQFTGADLVYGMKPVLHTVEAEVLAAPPAPDDEQARGRAVLENVRQRGALRVCVMTDRLPYAFLTPKGEVTGFDVEMAHQLAHDVTVRLQLVPATYDGMPDLLDGGACDLAMSGMPVTPQRASAMRFSHPYLDETLGFLVRDELREEFSTWASIRALGDRPVAAPNIPYYLAEVRQRAPELRLDVRDTGDPAQLLQADAVVLPAERGSAITLLYPKFTAVVPMPDPIKVPLAYPVARRDEQWASFVNMWIELKKRDGTIDALYRHWILGQNAVTRRPRWSVIRDVLHWVK